MKKLRPVFTVMLVMFGLVLFSNSVQAHASTTSTTPKSLRGTWYKYAGKNKQSVIKISKSRLVYNGTVYSPSKSGSHKLKVSKWGSWYSLNNGSLGQFKTEKRLIAGSYKEALVRYHGIGTYYVYSHHKYHKDYSFTILD